MTKIPTYSGPEEARKYPKVTEASRLLIVLQRMERLGQRHRPLWAACDGSVRCGHSLDMINLIEATGGVTRT